MARTVLIERPGAGLVVRRVSPAARAVARLRAASLDDALAAGVEPERRPALSLRAERLIAPAMRRRLAGSLRWYVDEARRRAGARMPWPAPKLPIGPQVSRAADELLALADLLEAPAPADVRGVAQVSVLLTDGNSPLHRNHGARRLVTAAQTAADALAAHTTAAA